MSNSTLLHLQALLGDYPNTRALKTGNVCSDRIVFDFADVGSPSKMFKRVVRNLEFDVAELAIVTYLTAMSKGIPLALLPVVVRGNFLHESIVCRADKALDPASLMGKRVGIRSHTVTTVTWVRGLLQNDFGVNLRAVNWVAFEDTHVPGIVDPLGSERANDDSNMLTMLAAGELDAAITGSEKLDDPRFHSLIPDTGAAIVDWQRKYQTMPINHMVIVKPSLLEAHPWLARALFELFRNARDRTSPDARGIDQFPLGVNAMRKSLALIISYAHQQGLIPREYTVDELFDATTRSLRQ